MEAPKHTDLIYETLRRGQFISSNSPDETSRQLYNILDDEENFDFLYDYFRVIKRTLEKGNGYYYFSRIEKIAEYNIEQHKNNILKTGVELKDYDRLAEKERSAALNKTQQQITNATRQKIEAEENLLLKEEKIEKQKEQKKREKDKKIKEQEKIIAESTQTLIKEIEQNNQEAQTAIEQLQTNKNKALNNQGADTEKISQLKNRIREISIELNFIEENRDTIARYKYDKEELFDKKEQFKEEKTKWNKKLELTTQRHETERKKIEEEEKKIEETYKEISQKLQEIEDDLSEFENFTGSSCYEGLAQLFQEHTPEPEHKTTTRSQVLIRQLYDQDNQLLKKWNELKSAINLFTGNFSPENIFNFPVRFDTDEDFLHFAGDLKEFIEEDKISEYEKRHNLFFADLIKQIGRETTGLLSQEGQIQNIIKDINHDFIRRNFAGVIKKIELRLVPSNNPVFHLLMEIKRFNDENRDNLGAMNLFTTDRKSQEEANKQATGLLERLSKTILLSKHSEIKLHDTFELEFQVQENDNDTGWVQNLANVGSDGTDVLVKAMINIMLLNVFKEKATKRGFQDFRLHCMMDEIGKLHPNNVKGILKFANDRNIYLVNGSPQSFDATAYRYTYQLSKTNHTPDGRTLTTIRRIITNNRRPE